MIIAIYIMLGIAALVFLIWLISEIQIRVWLKRTEYFFQNKYKKLKSEENEKQK